MKNEKLKVNFDVGNDAHVVPLLNRKTQKGITLIALVITIIVLLILAVVSVQIITNQGIIQHAENAVNLYEQKQDNELEQFNLVEQELNQYATGSNTGTSSNWWELTEEEKQMISYDSDKQLSMIAMNTTNRMVAFMGETTDVLAIAGDNVGGTGSEGWFFALTDVGETALKTIDSSSIKHQWYYTEDLSNYNGWREYTGESPIQLSDFTDSQIYCRSYLERIINNGFNN